MTNFTMLVHNRLQLTKQALDSLISHTFQSDITVTILFDGDDEETQKILAPWENKPRSTVLRTASLGTGTARNQVISASEEYFGRGDYLYLSDNDVVFKPNWLAHLIDLYERNSEVWVLGAYNHPYHQHGKVLVNGPGSRVMEVQALALQSMLMSWDVWDKYRPFQETSTGKVCQGEDVSFCHKITADGGKLGVVSPALLVNTGITNSCGEKIPGWELVQKECPAGVFCE